MPDCLSRITPACAGKRERGCKNGTDFQDHPRMCGEKYVELILLNFTVGSPPHVRGKDRGNRTA